MVYLDYLLTFIESNPALAIGFNLILLVISGFFAHLMCKFLLIKIVRKVFFSSHKQDVPLEKDRRIAEKLSNFIPVIIVYYVLQFMPNMPASLVTAINTICGILFFIFCRFSSMRCWILSTALIYARRSVKITLSKAIFR
ncbi:TPA: hypothetical protein ACIR6D_001337 [Enterobacter kobei]